MATRRMQRLSGLLREEIGDLLRRQVKDPRLSSLHTVTEVVISPDLRHAKVFVSVMGTSEEKKQTLTGLMAAAGFLRRELAGRLNLRHIPELDFRLDDSLAQGAHLLELIKLVTPPASTDPPTAP